MSAGAHGPGAPAPGSRPDGIPGSSLSGPFPVGHYAARLQNALHFPVEGRGLKPMHGLPHRYQVKAVVRERCVLGLG